MARTRTLALVGMADEDAGHLRDLLDRHRGELSPPWQIGTESAADLSLIDIDSVYGHMGWLKAHGSGRPAAAFTDAESLKDTDLILHKPGNGSDLVALLNRAAQTLPERKVATPPPAAAPAPAPRAAVAPVKPAVPPAPAAPAAPVEPVATTAPPAVEAPVAPAAPPPPPPPPHLADLIAGEQPATQPTRLAGDGLPTIVLDPEQQVWHASGNLKALAGWCLKPLPAGAAQAIGTAELASARAAHPAQPYARLLWLAELVRGQGQLDPGLEADARFKLARWPQSEREFPKHFRIATAMMKQPATLAEIAAQSGAPAGEVADFINAYRAIGFIEIEGVEVETSARGGNRLLSRLRKPFGA